jgi:hypothetical protein
LRSAAITASSICCWVSVPFSVSMSLTACSISAAFFCVSMATRHTVRATVAITPSAAMMPVSPLAHTAGWSMSPV